VNQALESLITTELDSLGYELVELRVAGSKRRPLLDVRIDRKDSQVVTVDDCATASRAIEARLDADGSLGERYVLEVSSPGVERPLRNASDWARFVGRRASVVADAVGGRKEVEIVRVEEDGGRTVACVRDDKGVEYLLPLADVREARLVFHWNR
jgi:ribosome maturation factor RimP